MKRIDARYLLGIPADELWDWLTGEFILVMDNGEEFKTNAAETCYSSYVWDFHRAYPATPLLKEHHLRGVSKGRRLSIGIDSELLGTTMMCVYDTYRAFSAPERVKLDPDLWRLAYDIHNKAYCGIIKHADAFVGTIDILHFHEAMDEPEIYEANRAVQNGEIHVHEVYAVIDKIFNDKTRLIGNPIAAEYRSKLLKQTQVHQNIGPRGNPTDMNSRIFSTAITRSYVEGIRDIYSSAVETRSAARSSYYAAESLRMSEYFSRKLQFVSQNVQNLHQDCDCGSKEYLDWTIRPDKRDDQGDIVRTSDLILLDGKYYLNELTGQLETIRPNMVNLIGQTVRLRTTLHCAHPDPAGVCSTCFGELALNVPSGANIGQWCATNMAEQATQALLSAKHLDRSSALDKIELSPELRKFVIGGPDNSSYCLSKEIEDKEVAIILLRSQVESLNDIRSVDDVEEHPPEHYSELTVLNIEVLEGIIRHKIPVPVGVAGSRDASLSHEMLNYIREKGWTTIREKSTKTSTEEKYRIDMSEWNWDDPVLVMPAKHFNNSDHVDQVARMLESRVAEMRKRARIESADKMILELFDYVNWKLNVNLSCLEVILYATTIVSAEHNDYSLPKPWTTSQPSVLSMTMNGRSLSVLMAFEKQYEALQAPASFINTNRFDHPFDGIYTPTQVFGKHPIQAFGKALI
jgi:hypothetical protein